MGRHVLIWVGLAAAVALPLILAGFSPLLAWRDPIYIIAGFSGIIGLVLLLIQPLLADRQLPGLSPRHHRSLHRATGGFLVLTIMIHVAGLWITSPPDVIDALFFASPTPFSVWGVIAMWAVFATALLAVLRKRLSPWSWRMIHRALAVIIVAGTMAHALLIQGTMETTSKWALCILVAVITARIVLFPKR